MTDKNKDRYILALVRLYLSAAGTNCDESVSTTFFVDGGVRVTTFTRGRRWLRRKGILDQHTLESTLQLLGFEVDATTDAGYYAITHRLRFCGITMSVDWSTEQEQRQEGRKREDPT